MKRGGGFEYEGCAIFMLFSFFFLRIEKREGRTKCRRETVNERVGRSGEGEEET